MKKIQFIIIALLFALPLPGFSGTGDIQITCEPNVRIFIDGTFKGITNESDNGLFLESISAGRHSLKAVKKGYEPYVKDITITEYKAIEEKISFTKRQEKIKSLRPDSGETLSKVGKLELRSAPLGAKVNIDGKGYNQKTDIEIENILVGQHRITFERGGQKLSGQFTVNESETLKLKAHFKERKIINMSEVERNDAKKEKFEAERNAEFDRTNKAEKHIEKGNDGFELWAAFLNKYPGYEPAEQRLKFWEENRGKFLYEGEWLTQYDKRQAVSIRREDEIEEIRQNEILSNWSIVDLSYRIIGDHKLTNDCSFGGSFFLDIPGYAMKIKDLGTSSKNVSSTSTSTISHSSNYNKSGIGIDYSDVGEKCSIRDEYKQGNISFFVKKGNYSSESEMRLQILSGVLMFAKWNDIYRKTYSETLKFSSGKKYSVEIVFQTKGPDFQIKSYSSDLSDDDKRDLFNSF